MGVEQEGLFTWKRSNQPLKSLHRGEVSLSWVHKPEQEVSTLERGRQSVMEGDILGRGSGPFKGLEL